MKTAKVTALVLVVFLLAALAGSMLSGCATGPADGTPCSVHDLARTTTNDSGDVLECVADPDTTGGYAWARIGKAS